MPYNTSVMKSSYRILLVDYRDVHVSPDIPFLFTNAGCIVDIYSPQSSWLLKNNQWNQWFPADSTDSLTYTQGLVALLANTHYDWVVCTSDSSIRVINDTLTDEKIAAKILPLSTLENRNILGSKAALSILSTQSGLTTPLFAIYSPNNDLVKIAKEISFPLLLKVDRSGGGKGVFFCADTSELMRTFTSLPEEHQEKLVLQKYIAGDNIAVEALYRNGTLIAYAHSKVIHNVHGEFSISAVRHYSSNPAIEKTLHRLGREFGINGFCSITFMRDTQTGTHYLVEADMRPHTWFILARFGGVDFSAAIQEYLAGATTLTQAPAIHSKNIEVRHFLRDVHRSLESRDFRTFAHWCFNYQGRWRFIPWYDRRVLLVSILWLAHARLYSATSLRPHLRRIKQTFNKIYDRFF